MTIPRSAIGIEPIYYAFQGMHARCRNPKYKCFQHYGGRGIAVCKEWSAFAPFKAWALANGWARGLTLDRRDNDKGYSPDNCRWATTKQQSVNRRVVPKNANGTAFCEIAQANGIAQGTYSKRINRDGWSPETAATTSPIRRRTHCKKGHLFTPESTTFTKKGVRYCLICKRETGRKSGKAYYYRLKAREEIGNGLAKESR